MSRSACPIANLADVESLRGHRSRHRRRLWTFLRLGVLVVFGLGFMLPLIWAFCASLKPLDQVYVFPPQFRPRPPQWDNYRQILDPGVARLPFPRFLLNTAVISVASVIGTVLTSSMAGYALARLPWRSREFWFIVLLITMMLPGQVLLIPHFLIYKNLGWVNTYKPLIVPAWLGGGAFFVFLFRQFFRSVPRELEEAALIDGASRWQIYWELMLPLARPAVATVAVLSFIGHWQEFMGPLIYLSDFERYPISLGLRMFQNIGGSWTNLLMAASLVSLLPLAVLFLLVQRYFVRGLFLSGTKG